MPRNPIPDALGMKALKYGNRPDTEKDQVAEALRAAGRRAEALLLFEGRPEHAFLQEEKRWAIEEGVAFHLQALSRLGVAIEADALRACGHAAEARGRWMDARQCWRKLDDAEGLQRVAPHLPEALRPEEAALGEGDPA